jgi:hypothetical protein
MHQVEFADLLRWCAIPAGISFAAIAVVVAVRGIADLKSLIRTLAARRP